MADVAGTTNPALDTETEVLLRRIYPALRRFAAVTGSAQSEPDDLVQEALLRTMRTRTLTEIEFPEAYLRRAILNLVMNERRTDERRRRSLRKLSAGAAAGTPDDYPSDLAELFTLPAQTRAVLYMAEIERASHAEIAAALGISAAHSRILASRARRTLRAQTDGDAK